MKALHLLLLTAWLPCTPACAGWDLQATTPVGDHYIDKSTAQPVGKLHRVWEMQDLGEPSRLGVRSTRYWSEYDCAGARHRMLRFEAYTGPKGTGALNDKSSEPGGWVNVAPGTTFASTLKFVCQEWASQR